MTKDQIRTIFMQRGFTIKEGQGDLKEYVYEAANDLIRAVQQEIAASAPNPSDKQEPVAIYHGNGIIDCGDAGHHNIELLKMIPAGAKLYVCPRRRYASR